MLIFIGATGGFPLYMWSCIITSRSLAKGRLEESQILLFKRGNDCDASSKQGSAWKVKSLVCRV